MFLLGSPTCRNRKGGFESAAWSCDPFRMAGFMPGSLLAQQGLMNAIFEIVIVHATNNLFRSRSLLLATNFANESKVHRKRQ